MARAIKPNTRLEIYKRDGYRCVACGSANQLTVDHIKPVSVGGSNEPGNLQTMCHNCNTRKGNYMPTWFERYFPIITHKQGHNLKNEMLGAMVSKDGLLEKRFQSMMDKRLAEIQPKVQTFITEHVKNLEQNALLKVTGFNNALEGYTKRGLERDEHLMKIIKLLCQKVEELENHIYEKENSS